MEQTPQEKINEQFLAAASEGSIEKAIDCLTNGADLNSKTLKGNNALYLSGTRNRKDFFDWILEVTQKGNVIDVNNVNKMGDNLLFEMVREKVNVYYVEKLLTKKVEVDAISRSGGTALLQACANADFEVAECLVKNKANPNSFIEKSRTTPMLMAAAEGSFDILKLLVENGGNLNELDKTGKNVLLNALFRSTTYMKKEKKEEHYEMIKYLINSEVDLDYVAPSGVSAIWIASYMGKDDIVKMMLDKGVVVDRWHQLTPSEGNLSVTHILSRRDNEKLLRQVLEMGGKLSVPDELGNYPESYGLQNPNFRSLLLEYNADVNAVIYINDKQDNSLIGMPIFPNIVAQGDTSFEEVEEMLKRGAKINYKKEWDSFDPVLAAIASSSPLITALLLKQPDAQINKLLNLNPSVLEKESYSYLSIACSNINSKKLAGAIQQRKHFENLLDAQKENQKNGIESEILSKEDFDLIQKKYDILNQVEDAIKRDKKIIFDCLINAGIDIELSNEKGKTALFYCKNVDDALWLQKAGANIFHKDNSGNTVFTKAIIDGNTELIDFYKDQYKLNQNLDNIYYRMAFEEVETFSQQKSLEKGILHFAGGSSISEKIYPKNKEDFIRQEVSNIDYKDSDGNTALLVTCANDMPFLTSLYHKLGADINVKNNLGETPLMHAVASKNIQLIEYLVENGADSNEFTNAGKSVMDFALETNSNSVVNALNKKDVLNSKKVRI